MNKFSGNAARKRINYEGRKAIPSPGLPWKCVSEELRKNFNLSRTAGEALLETVAPWTMEADVNDAVQLWMFNYANIELLARAHPDPDTREHFLGVMHRQREAMNNILKRAGARSRIPEPEPAIDPLVIRGFHIEEF